MKKKKERKKYFLVDSVGNNTLTFVTFVTYCVVLYVSLQCRRQQKYTVINLKKQ